MFRYLTLLLLLPLINAVGQNHISGRIVDYEKGTPVKYAQVRFSGTYCGTATNRNGEFLLNTGECSGEELVITSATYERKIIPLGQVTQPMEIALQRKMSRNTFRPDQSQVCDVVQTMLTKIPQNYYGKKYAATSFHREYVKSFDNIVQLMEGVIRTQNASGHDEYAVHDFIFAEDKNQRDIFWHPSTGGFYTFGWQRIAPEGTPSARLFLGVHLKSAKDLAKYYDFICFGSLHDSGETTYLIKFDQKDNVKAALFRGTLYIDSATHALTRVEYEMSPRGFPYSHPNIAGGLRICKPPLKLEVVRESGEINYQKIGSRWFLANQVVTAQFNAGIDSANAKRSEHFLKIRTEKVVTQVDTSVTPGTTVQASRKAIDHNYIKRNFENYQSSATDWPGAIILKADTSIFEVVRTLRINNQLWERKEGRKALIALRSSTTFTPDQLRKDLAYLKDMFSRLHPVVDDPMQKAHFNRLIGSAERRLQRNTSENEFYRMLAPVIESVHCGHTQLMPSVKTEEFNRRFGKYFPLDLVVLGRHAFVTSGAADATAGSEVLEINGTAMTDILQNIRYKASTEGASASDKDYFLGKNFAELYAMNYFQADSFKVTIMDHETRQVRTSTFPASGYRMKESNGADHVRIMDSIQTVLINLPKIPDDVSVKKFLEKIFPKIDASRYANMIIDLRDNDCFGDGDAATLFSYLAGAPFTYFKSISLSTGDTTLLQKLHIGNRKLLLASPGFASGIVRTDSVTAFIDHPGIGELHPASATFRGNLFVIVNGGSSSAAIDFAKFVQLQDRGTVVGQESVASFHGTCDSGKAFLTLPNSRMRITLPFATYEPAINTINNMKLIPDHQVEYTVDDIVRKRDPEMEVCRNLIVASCCSAKSN